MEDLFNRLPVEFVENLKNDLSKEDFEKYKRAINQSAVRGVRINKKRVNVEEFVKNSNLKLKPLSFCDDGFLLKSDEKLGNSSQHLSGAIYLQEPSSMLAVAASEIEKEEKPLKVLDLCASPGGKSSQIASRILEDSLLFSNEIIKSRAQVLFSNIERQGFRNVIVLNEEPKKLECFEGYFDYVFVDAPCSGEGMFRKNPETINEWSLENVKLSKNRQIEILQIATKLVKSGGKLVYSTCTLNCEEDEEIVEFLVHDCGFELVDVSDAIKFQTKSSKAKVENAEFARKFYNFSGDGEGQFVAVLKNNNDAAAGQIHSKKHFNSIFEVGRTDFKFVKEFFDKNLNLEGKIFPIQVGNNVFLPPKSFDSNLQTLLDSLKFISIGTKIGTIEKGRFEPNHNLFMAYDNLFKTKIELSDENLAKYLHGEEIMCDITPQNSGIYVVLTKNDLPIGGGKLVGNKVKNLYPKGMRI